MTDFPLVFMAALAFLSHVAQCQVSCTAFTTEISCISQSDNTCNWVTSAVGSDLCQCKANVKLDILFAIDTSGSIGLSAFKIQKEFLHKLVTQSINNNASKIGFLMFSTNVNFSKHITTWNTTELDTYVSGLYWNGGYTNTPGALRQALHEFNGDNTSYVPDSDRQKILMIITDGNPCLSPPLGGCPQYVCQYETPIKDAGIRTVIIGVGDGLNRVYVQCLTQSDDDFTTVPAFSDSDFDSIMSSLSGVLCPVAKDFKITEVKAMRKPSSWIEEGDGRYTRFVEIYNNGIEFNLNTVKASGLISMDAGPDVIVPQGTYVVFYDAADLPASASGSGAGASMPSCHLCGDDCTLTSCSIAGQRNTGYCWCQNSIYIACDNQADTNCQYGVYTDAGVAPSDHCGSCTFSNTQDKANWDIQFLDENNILIDDVTYEGAPAWIETTDKFSYELRSNGFNNDYGANWLESCSPLGTPGAGYFRPTTGCTVSPTLEPTLNPTIEPTVVGQTYDPTASPTRAPTTMPTKAPTVAPHSSTLAPSAQPSADPTDGNHETTTEELETTTIEELETTTTEELETTTTEELETTTTEELETTTTEELETTTTEELETTTTEELETTTAEESETTEEDECEEDEEDGTCFDAVSAKECTKTVRALQRALDYSNTHESLDEACELCVKVSTSDDTLCECIALPKDALLDSIKNKMSGWLQKRLLEYCWDSDDCKKITDVKVVGDTCECTALMCNDIVGATKEDRDDVLESMANMYHINISVALCIGFALYTMQ